jgi:hypothetical protein
VDARKGAAGAETASERAREEQSRADGEKGGKERRKEDDGCRSRSRLSVCQRRAAQGQRCSVAAEHSSVGGSEGPITLYTAHSVGGTFGSAKVRHNDDSFCKRWFSTLGKDISLWPMKLGGAATTPFCAGPLLLHGSRSVPLPPPLSLCLFTQRKHRHQHQHQHQQPFSTPNHRRQQTALHAAVPPTGFTALSQIHFSNPSGALSSTPGSPYARG